MSLAEIAIGAAALGICLALFALVAVMPLRGWSAADDTDQMNEEQRTSITTWSTEE